MMKNYMKRSLMLLGASVAVMGASASWVDVTNQYMKDAAYTPGWQGAITGHDYGVAEVWNGAFRVYQVLNDMPAGDYTLTANAFYRCGYNDYASEKMKGVDATPELYRASIFINDTKKPVAGLFDNVKTITPEGEDFDPAKYAPNWLGDANTAFEAGLYVNTLTVSHPGGTMVIGITSDGCYDDEWCAFDNFKLTGPNGEVTLVNGDFSTGLDSKREWNNVNAENGEKTPDMQKDGAGGGVYRKCGGSPYKYGQQVELPAGKYRYGMLTFHRYGSTLNPDGTYYHHKSGEVTAAYGVMNRTPKDWFDANDYDEVADENYAHAYLFVAFGENCPNILKGYDDFGDLTDKDIRVRIKDSWEICKGNYDEMPDNNPYGLDYSWDWSREMANYEVRNVSNYWHDSGNEREAAAAFVANPEKWYQYVEFELTEPAKVWIGMGKDANTSDGYWHAWADQTLKMYVDNGDEPVDPDPSDYPEAIYMVGDINGWNINSDEYTLKGDGKGVYSASIEYPAFPGDRKLFRFYTMLGEWGSDGEFPSIGAGPNDGVQHPFEFNEQGIYEGECFAGKGNWEIKNWLGGPIMFTVDLANMTVVFDGGEAAGVKTISTENGEEVIYNLQGVKVSRENMGNGLYIINGKKVMVRK